MKLFLKINQEAQKQGLSENCLSEDVVNNLSTNEIDWRYATSGKKYELSMCAAMLAMYGSASHVEIELLI